MSVEISYPEAKTILEELVRLEATLKTTAQMIKEDHPSIAEDLRKDAEKVRRIYKLLWDRYWEGVFWEEEEEEEKEKEEEEDIF